MGNELVCRHTSAIVYAEALHQLPIKQRTN